MTAEPDRPYGPYTVDDLDMLLNDDGFRRELVHGWIVEGRPPSTFTLGVGALVD